MTANENTDPSLSHRVVSKAVTAAEVFKPGHLNALIDEGIEVALNMRKDPSSNHDD
jgi:hypothetical protein